MNKQSILQMLLLGCVFFTSCCTTVKNREEQRGSPSVSNGQERQENRLITELHQLYQATKSQYERRAICLRAIDEGIIHRGASVSVLDEVFGTNFVSDLPTKEEAIKKNWVLFAEQHPPTPESDEPITSAHGYVGWYMGVDYDVNGSVQDYRFANLHKSISSYEPPKEPVSIAELKRLYETAQSEAERRVVCLRAIDEGVIKSAGPVSTIDEIFGTHFAANLPTRKEQTRQVSVVFTTPTSPSPSPDNRAAVPTNSTGWYMVVKYYYDGSISNYYLTNIRQ